MTTTVYDVGFDLLRFRSLQFDGDDDAYRAWARPNRFDGQPKGTNWEPPSVFVPEPLLAEPDFWYFYGIPSLLLGHRALEYAEALMLQAGELLPVPLDGSLLRALNITRVVDCLDSSASRYGRGGNIAAFAFIEHRLPEQSVFTIPQHVGVSVFAIERCGDPEWELKALVEAHHLSGLTFTELWNSEAGPLDQDPLAFFHQ